MASTGASLALLQGKNKTPPPAAEEVTAAPDETASDAAGDTEEVQIEPDNMSKAEIDKLVADPDYGITAPENWAKMKLAEKRAWLKAQFPEEGAEADEADATEEAATEEVAAEVAEPAPEPAKPTTKPAAPKKDATKPAPKVADKSPAAPPVATPKAKPQEAAETVAARPEKPSKKSGDKISDLVYEVEHLKEKAAKELLNNLTDDNDFSAIKLGGVMAKIQASGWWAPYASFREFVEREHGMKYRKAMYWVQIYNDLVTSKVPWSAVQHIGWTKLREISKVITLENIAAWVEVAENSTVVQLREHVANSLKGNEGEPDGSDQSSKTVSTKTFKVHDDQKEIIAQGLAKNKNQTGTDYDTTALVNIVSDYLSKPTLAQMMKSVGIDKVSEALAEAFPEYAFTATEK